MKFPIHMIFCALLAFSINLSASEKSAAKGLSTSAKAKNEAPVVLDDEGALKIIKSSDCFACHHVTDKLVGPAYLDIAKKYSGDPNATKLLVTKIKEGGSGTWGPVPMIPHTTMKVGDIEKLVAWILNMAPAPDEKVKTSLKDGDSSKQNKSKKK